MSNQRKIKVLVVDDHPVVRAGLGAIVSYQDDLELVGEAATAAEAIGLFKLGQPDVTLVDLALPDLTGIELITLLRAKSATARFLVLTANAGGSEIGEACAPARTPTSSRMRRPKNCSAPSARSSAVVVTSHLRSGAGQTKRQHAQA